MRRAFFNLLAALLAVAPAGVSAQTPAACPVLEPAAEPGDWRGRVERSRRLNEIFACQAKLDTQQKAAARARMKGAGGRLEDFSADETLRRGDAVVTDKGVRIFRGSADAPAPADFDSAAGAKGTARQRRALDEIDRANAAAR